MRIRAASAMAGLLSLSTLALAQKVRFDYHHGADFPKYHTYRLVEIADNPAVSLLAHQRIINAIKENLAKKGFTKVETGGDLLVGYQASVESQQQYTTFNDGFGPGWGYGSAWSGSSVSTTTATTIPVGGLTIDMMDPAKKQLVFRGTASGTLSDKPDKNAEKIRKSVQKILEKYPPKTS